MSDDDINETPDNAAEETPPAPEKKLRIPTLDDLPGGEETKSDSDAPPLPEAPVEEPQEAEPEPHNDYIESEGLSEIQKYMPQDTEGHKEDKPFEDFTQEEDGPVPIDMNQDKSLKTPSLDDLPPMPEEEEPAPELPEGEVAAPKEEGTEEGEGSGPRVAPEPRKDELEVNYVTSDVIELKIGDDIGLTNKDPTLKKIRIGAGWEARSLEGDPPDVDLSCFILNKDDQTRKDPDFVFYNNRQSEEGELIHKGDSRTGAGDGDDEMVEVDLQAFPFEVSSIMLVLSIHDGEVNEQDFSMVKDVFVRLVNLETSQELCKLVIPDKFTEDHKGCAMKVGRIFRDGPKWRFHGCTEVVPKGGLRKIATEYGIIVV